MEGKKLRRPRNSRMIAGVCSGIARFFDLDPTLVRLIYALLTVFTAFAGVIIYLIMWIIVPEDNN